VQPVQTFALFTFVLEMSLLRKLTGMFVVESKLDTCPETSRTWLLLIPESAGKQQCHNRQSSYVTETKGRSVFAYKHFMVFYIKYAGNAGAFRILTSTLDQGRQLDVPVTCP
jgi:hypothetical protein